MKTPDHPKFWRRYFAATDVQQSWLPWLTAQERLKMRAELMQWNEEDEEVSTASDVATSCVNEFGSGT